MMEKGKIYLVGAGPGDPELLTVRARDLLTEADCVIYDALVNPAILNLVPLHAQLIYVGKRADHHSYTQEEINDIILQEYRPEGIVVRLKGGDPFVFGRGGEEMLALAQGGIPFEVVPGITSGIAAPEYMSIPVTHRGISTSVTLITGFTKELQAPDADWDALVRLGGTLVFYMSTRTAPLVSAKLVEAGMSPDTPMAIITNGTLPHQTMICDKISAFTDTFTDYEILAPGLVVIGDVIGLKDSVPDRPQKPLQGQNILVTRSLHQSSNLADMLSNCGANPILLPTIEITPLEDQSCLRSAFENISSYNWIFFTSVNGVEVFFDELLKGDRDIRAVAHCSFAVVGKATGDAMMKYGLKPDFVPAKHTGEDMVAEFVQSYDMDGVKVLLPGSVLSRDAIKDNLSDHGVVCDFIPVYDNQPIHYSSQRLEVMRAIAPQWITFCSSSAVTNFMKLVDNHGLQDWIRHSRIACIGELTAHTATHAGLQVDVMPHKPLMELLVQEIINYTQQQTH
ncbi:uroporphyrinogen-III C-methyltransferase [Porphyromonas pogonae]|uniref:uroporphyrinogen-III C-methyltransferase n=1 Tax=Porphyromonas pogonae TaxID=867595 RepID=UPI002E79D87B|nr:uroporphyrinogen-III C-methyltransferase [Porphyromonas pogonae]